MNVLIVEDEALARDYLKQLLFSIHSRIEIIGETDSVKNAIKWFLKNPEPDLIFMDVNLGDGLCFEIFDVIDIKTPVVFTTAYDQYAIDAFKVNSVDYLLKPVEQSELIRAIEKYKRLNQIPYSYNIDPLLSTVYKKRFIIKVGDHLKILETKDLTFFFSQDKITFGVTKTGRRYPVEFSLDLLEKKIDPELFFRINRKHLIAYQAIQDIIVYSNSRLKLMLLGADDDFIVSRDRIHSFKKWLNR